MMRRLRRPRGEGGAVLVEVALILPMLVVISLGVLELGMGWKASMTASSATRSGARVASNLGTSWQSDRQALLAISASLGNVPTGDIERVVIFRSTSADGAVPSACLNATALSTGGNATSRCNVYRGVDLDNVASLSFPSSCAGRHQYWCPSTRVNAQSAVAGLDFIGVYIKLNHTAVTRMFGSTIPITDTTVMRIEPNAGNE